MNNINLTQMMDLLNCGLGRFLTFVKPSALVLGQVSKYVNYLQVKIYNINPT